MPATPQPAGSFSGPKRNDIEDSSDPGTLRAEILRLRSELDRAELAVEAARMEANATQESKERFLSQVAHELRTPLSAIVLWSGLIEEEKVSEPKQLRHAIDAIRTSAEEQRILIDHLLEMSRILAGKIDLEQKRVDLATIVHSAVEKARPTATQRSIVLAEINPGSAIVVRGDGPQLERALSNLVANAIQVLPAGGEVKVELRPTGDFAEMSVIDNGPGFAPEAQPLMLRGAPVQGRSQRHASYGLGLPIARKIAELHGGELLAESDGEGSGARFTLRLLLLR